MNTIYRLLSLYLDGQAIRRGRYPQRLARKEAYRVSGSIIRNLFR